jgi:redox-sensitive bicupin YhaK (pirin superfamily)
MPILRTLNGRLAEIAPAMSVRRVLPAAAQRSVGPFVFFDHFGPTKLSPVANADVVPHPHIGLATVTYLLAGEMIHRDSIGTVQAIQPGDINLMTAGSGVVHSERVPEALRRNGGRLEGLQLWVALPQEQEDAAPSFQHVDRSDIPEVNLGGVRVRILIGSAFGETSPVAASSRTLYLDLTVPAGATCELAVKERQLAVYSPDARMIIDGVALDPRVMAVISPGSPARMSCEADGRLIVIGGDPLPKPAHMWWNFVSTHGERIARAADRWRDQQFPVIAGETDLATMPPFPRSSPKRAGP